MATGTAGMPGDRTVAATDHGQRCRTTGRVATVRRNPSASRSTNPRVGTRSARDAAAVARSAHSAVATNITASK